MKTQMKFSLFLVLLMFTITSKAQVDRELNSPASIEESALGFNSSPELFAYMKNLIASSRFREKIVQVAGFNNQILDPDASRLEKLIRQETPYTVSLMGKEILEEVSDLKRFRAMGLVYGDPHNGNLNIQPIVFRDHKLDQNRYTLIDLDEVSVGIFSLDFARYVIFLKATHGSLEKKFGMYFSDELVKSYSQGLKQESYGSLPAFIEKSLNATSKEIRQKLVRYAEERVDKNGEFRHELFEKKELALFAVKNMKPGFLAKLNFNKDLVDNKKFKNNLFKFLITTAQGTMGAKVKVLDIAIPQHITGGSASMQRFLLSTEVKFEGKKYPMLLEFKENTERPGWDAVIESPLQSSIDRYKLAIQATIDDPGPFQKIVRVTENLSFLMRPKGNLDIEPKSRSDIREQALYNAYLMGRFHGGQGPSVSQSYRDEVLGYPLLFQTTVFSIASKVLMKLAQESDLEIPH